jgi:hypothetical protein
MPDCLRCGRCCHFIVDGKIVKCRYLIKIGATKTTCRIFKNRLGVVIGKTEKGERIKCADRKAAQFDYPGCPFNTGKPMFPEET